MSTAKQLIPTFVDAQPIVWNRDYVQNMREIRGYPNWWRIRDDESFIDGPPTEGIPYSREFFLWRAKLVESVEGSGLDTIELYNLGEFLTRTEEVVDGDTVYKYKYRDAPPALSYTHTGTIDSVSLEFDQIGRRLVSFESLGMVYLIWYNPVAAEVVVESMGQGVTPHVVTDSYYRTGDTSGSERLLFYIDSNTSQIVYRKQLDRYETVYPLPSAPSDVVEILKVSKNLYGGLTVLYVYEDSPGNLSTGSFTARVSPDGVALGSDGQLQDFTTALMRNADIQITKREALASASAKDSTAACLISTANFALVDSTVRLYPSDTTSVTLSNAVFSLVDVTVNVSAKETTSALVSTGTLSLHTEPLYLTGNESLTSALAQQAQLLNFSIG